MMHKEIERKFLISGGFKDKATHSEYMSQGYIASSKESSVRIRIAGDNAFLTIKANDGDNPVARFEWEKPIEVNEARQLLDICCNNSVSKTRYYVPLGSYTAEVDVFDGANIGLVMVEVEFASIKEAQSFQGPEWFGREITGEDRYYNIALSEHPYSEWKVKDN